MHRISELLQDFTSWQADLQLSDETIWCNILVQYERQSNWPFGAPPRAARLDDSYFQIPVSDDHLHTDPDYSVDDYFS